MLSQLRNQVATLMLSQLRNQVATLMNEVIFSGNISALEALVSLSHRGIIKLDVLLREPNPEQKPGVTLAHMAAEQGYDQVIEKLSELGVDFNKTEQTLGATPAYVAAQNGRLNVIRSLGKHGADLNKQNVHGLAPIHVAALAGKIEIVRILIEEFGIDGHQKTRNGQTLLELVKEGQQHFGLSEEIIEQLTKVVRSSEKSSQEQSYEPPYMAPTPLSSPPPTSDSLNTAFQNAF